LGVNPTLRQANAAPEAAAEVEGTAGAPAAPSRSLDRLAGVVEEAMIAAGYSPAPMQAANRHDLRLLLRRLTLSAQDTRRILGLFRRILWRLNHLGS